VASWLAAGAATRVAEEAPFAGHASRSVDQLAGFLDAFLAVLPTAPRALIPPGLQVTFRRMLWNQGNQLYLPTTKNAQPTPNTLKIKFRS